MKRPYLSPIFAILILAATAVCFAQAPAVEGPPVAVPKGSEVLFQEALNQARLDTNDPNAFPVGFDVKPIPEGQDVTGARALCPKSGREALRATLKYRSSEAPYPLHTVTYDYCAKAGAAPLLVGLILNEITQVVGPVSSIEKDFHQDDKRGCGTDAIQELKDPSDKNFPQPCLPDGYNVIRWRVFPTYADQPSQIIKDKTMIDPNRPNCLIVTYRVAGKGKLQENLGGDIAAFARAHNFDLGCAGGSHITFTTTLVGIKASRP